MNNFNSLAPFYDRLKYLVFGRSLEQAGAHFLKEIRPKDSVLVLGGGTGEVLNHLLHARKVVFVDKSAAMIKRARSHSFGEVEFHCADIMNLTSGVRFEWIICPFFLDSFGEHTLPVVLSRIRELMYPGAQVIITDFKPRSLHHRMLVWLMYRFFILWTKLDARDLPNFKQSLSNQGFTELKTKEFSFGVFSSIYRC